MKLMTFFFVAGTLLTGKGILLFVMYEEFLRDAAKVNVGYDGVFLSRKTALYVNSTLKFRFYIS